MKPKNTITTFPRLSIVCTMGLLPLVSNADSLTWDGDQDGNWETDNAGDTNWDNVGSVLPVAGDDLSFGGVSNTSTTNDVADLTSFTGIAFTNDGSAGTQDAAFTLAGNSITLGGNITTTAATTGTLEDTIALDLVLDANRSIFANPGHSLNITGDISGAFTLTLGANNSAGKAPITFSGSNTHSLTALNRNASVRVESNTALGGQVNMARNASIDLANGVDLTAAGGITRTVTGTPQQSIRLNEDGTATASINASTGITNNLGGQFMNFVVGEDDTLTINGVLSGLGVNRKGGLGTLVLTNPANTNSGTLQAYSGSLVIGGSGILGASSSILAMGGGSLDLGTSAQTIATLNITGASASGDTIHNGSISATTFNATLGAGNAIISANLLDGSAGLTKSGNGTLTLSGTNTYTGSTTVTAGSLITTQASALPGYDSVGLVTFDGGTIGVQVGGLGWTSGEMNDLLTNANKTSGALGIDTTNGNFILSSDFSGTIGLSKLGANALTLSGNNTYTGNTTLSEGTLNINSATALGDAASTFTIGSDSTIDNTTGSALTLTNDNPISLPQNGFTYGGTQDLNLGAGPIILNLPPNNTTRIITLGGTGSTLTIGGASTSPSRGGNTNIQVDGAGNTLVFGSLGLNESVANRTNTWSGSANVTVNGGVLDDGAQRFTYAGTGTFTIGGACTYNGNTTVTSGVLALAAGGSLSDDTNVIINGGVIDLAAGVNDTVANLTVIGVNGDAALPDGEYGSTASGADNGGLGVGALDGFLTGLGTFTIDNGTPYDDWAMGPFTNPFTMTDPSEDPDGDGLDNLLEFVLGGDPTISQPGIAPAVSSPSSGSLVVTFNRSDSSQEDPATTVTVEVSPDLTFSTPANDIVIGEVDGSGPNGATYTVGASSGGLQLITVTIPGGGAKNFARVLAE